MSGRKVFVSSDMSVDERLLLVSEKNGLASLLWPWLLTALDDWGRCEATPLRLKARVWPMNDTVSVALITEAIALFAEVELVERYVVDGRAYLRIPPARWWKWQTHIHKDKREDDRSRLPAPESEKPREPAVLSAIARTRAESRGIARDSVPSPSPSPSLTPSLSHADDAVGEQDTQREKRVADMRADVRALGDASFAPADASDDGAAPLTASQAADAALSVVAAPAPHADISRSSPATRPVQSARPAGKVTPLSAAHTARVPDPVWDACIAAMGAAPSNRVERGKWAKGIQALKESLIAAAPPSPDGSPVPITAGMAAEIAVRSQRYRARFGASVPLNPMALAGNWTTLATDISPTAQRARTPEEGQRHGSFTQSGRYTTAGRRDGKPAIGTPAYYEQAARTAATQREAEWTHTDTRGAAGEGVRAAAIGQW